MSKELNLRPVINKKNGQINFSIPKKKLSKKLLGDIMGKKIITVKLEHLD